MSRHLKEHIRTLEQKSGSRSLGLRRNFNRQLKMKKKYPSFFLQGGFIEKPHRSLLKDIGAKFNKIKPTNPFQDASVWGEIQLELRNLRLCVESFDDLMLTVYFLKDEKKKEETMKAKENLNKKSLEILSQIHQIFVDTESEKEKLTISMEILSTTKWSDHVDIVRQNIRKKCDEYRQDIMWTFREEVMKPANVQPNEEESYDTFEKDWNKMMQSNPRPSSP